ncbi:MAG TPA: glycoside hydrolase 100 family protein [Bryobacteraceae bacterium]|nr:glycoside hydrolase 100 family protein [Bryobacteraceae bacterium]
MKASGFEIGHHQVWARDSMITLLGARFAQDDQIQTALHASITLLRSKQSSTGVIPNNVDCVTLRPNFRAYADAGLWWIIGSSLLAPDPETTSAILRWYACQDVDQSGLISMQEGADWQDLFCTRGKGLYLNCLYVLALRAAGQHERAELVAGKINQYFWYHGDGNVLRHSTHTFSTENQQAQDSLGRTRWLPAKRQLVSDEYYLPYLGFRAVGEWFDTLGNLLAILAGVASQSRTATILDFIERHGMAEAPMLSLTPVVQPGESDWRDYYGTLNIPHQYHNGGVWPFIGGFYVAALVKAGELRQAERAFDRLTALNRDGEFNEWHHGQTLEPMGVVGQAWSAGMYLFARECLSRSEVPEGFFGIGGSCPG